jgi:hypothetical protein
MPAISAAAPRCLHGRYLGEEAPAETIAELHAFFLFRPSLTSMGVQTLPFSNSDYRTPILQLFDVNDSFWCPSSAFALKSRQRRRTAMRIYTVTRGDRAVAVVRAADAADAADTAAAMLPTMRRDALAVREPNDAEMVGWLERRADYVMEPAVA